MVFFYEMHYNILLLNLVLTKIKGKTMTYTPILILSLLPILAFAEMSAEQARAERERQWQAEYEREMAKQFPTLQQEATLAGITMPAGTKLGLLSKHSVGEEAVKPEYFETAEFPQAVMWQGLLLKSINRRLQSSHCFERHNFDFEVCKTLPEKERETQIHWGWYLDTVLAEPSKINGFICKDEVHWKRPEILKPYPMDKVPNISAEQPAPEFVFDMCVLAEGNEFQSKNGELSFRLPEKSRIFRTRFMGNSLPDMWTGNDYGDTLSFNLFDLETMSNWYLNLQSRDLYAVSGTIVKNTPTCPIEPQSYVEWHASQPETLKVYSKTPVSQCGRFKIEQLKNPPQEIELEFLHLEV
ncbi:hypothetical protein [Moraxella bovis]|uniref:Uncharacterized protein n=2 Tax=Moraxella bovis TaxID=476 RepID=A0AAX3EVW6_MORBO|nr:hypothetical protein [Moraxella bovis]UYZ76201.1 hypothetical protein LP093_02430 [Moraxella bovis]UYZ77845.1 hypothetical protein LP115_11365 [Moraxella bovis]UYZ86331.1 hypothetical protein LP094_11415 [Moraxella bovis]UYZ89011.1 hypothetical protein LP114_11360 [Moraxella bovis]UYZ91764.1 hypothetical protein LP103_11475 [Moraxella bovis]